MAVTSMANSSIRDFQKFNAMSPITNGILFSVDYLVVAGGGAGGRGGAGAGGSLSGSFAAAPGTALSVEVGAGGAAITSNGTLVNNGNDSTFASFVSVGGGGGAGSAVDGGSGGSGAGAYGSKIPGTGTADQGNDGGSGLGSGSGGGGGAGAVGANAASSSVSGDGGVGAITTLITSTQAGTLSVGEVSGSDVYFAGGGGGWVGNGGTPGDGGLGGGRLAKIGSASPGLSGLVNTGGGAGGVDRDGGGRTGGSGGSGVILLSLPSTFSVSFTGGVTSGNVTADGTTVYAITAAGPTDTVTIG